MGNQWFESVAVAQGRAEKRLPKSVYGALIAGSEGGISMGDNVAAFHELGFSPCVAGRPDQREMATTVMGQPVSMPVLISPVGVQAVHPEGEVAVARAAAARGVAMGLSSFASKPIEDVVAANPQTFFQLYWAGDRDSIVARAQRAPRRGRDRTDTHSGLVVLPFARLGESHHSRAIGTRDDPPSPPRGRAATPMAASVDQVGWTARSPGTQLRHRWRSCGSLLRGLRDVDPDSPADMGRRGVAAGPVGRSLHAEGGHAGRGRGPGGPIWD